MKPVIIIAIAVGIVVVGVFSFDSAYGQWFEWCRDTPAGKICPASDPKYFTPFTIGVYLAIAIGGFFLFYFLLGKTRMD